MRLIKGTLLALALSATALACGGGDNVVEVETPQNSPEAQQNAEQYQQMVDSLQQEADRLKQQQQQPQ